MESNKYEPIKFDSWQELAKYVIDGGEVYFKALDHKYIKVWFSGVGFNCDIEKVFVNRDTYIRKQHALEELISIKPRLCFVWNHIDDTKIIREIDCFDNGLYFSGGLSRGMWWKMAQMLTDDEIKQFLNGE